MNSSVYNYYWLITGFIYEKIFHDKMSNEAINFLKNMSYVGLGTFIAAIFSTTFNILSGRLLGPTEYGEFNLVQSIAMFLYIPMLMGFHVSMVKYNSEKKEFQRQQKIISTTYTLVFILVFSTILLYKIFESKILSIFSISNTQLNLSIIFAILFVFYTLNNETLRSLHEMKRYAILKSIFSIVSLLSFLLFIYFNFRDSRTVIFALYTTYGITSLITLPFIWKYLKFKLDREWITKLTKYSSYAIMGGISSILYSNIDQILINKYMQFEDIGIYKAYNYSFTSILLVMTGIFFSSFFPYASYCDDKKTLLEKINRITIYLLILGLPLSIFGGLIILKLYGDKYGFDLKLGILFGILAVCMSIDGLYGQLMSSIGIKGIKVVSYGAIVLAIVNTLLDIYLIPKIGIYGTVIATIISYIISIAILLSNLSLTDPIN